MPSPGPSPLPGPKGPVRLLLSQSAHKAVIFGFPDNPSGKIFASGPVSGPAKILID